MSSFIKNKSLHYGSGNNTVTADGLSHVTLTDSGGYNKLTFGSDRREEAISESRLTLNGRNTLTGRARETVLEESSITFNHSGNNVTLQAGESALDESRLYFKGGSNTLRLFGNDDTLSDSRISFSGSGNTVTLSGRGTALDESRIEGAGNDKITIAAGRTALDESSISLASGNNSLSISGATALSRSAVKLGNGHDSLNIAGAVSGRSSIDTGGGNDSIQLNSTVSSSSVRAGVGNDVIRLLNGAKLTSNAVIDGGAGVDTLRIDALKTFSPTAAVAPGSKITSVEVLNMEGGSGTGLYISSAALSRFSPDAMTSGLSGQRLLRVRGDATDRVNFELKEKWAVVVSQGKAVDYKLDGTVYQLWKNASGSRILVEKGVPVTYLTPPAPISGNSLDYSHDSMAHSLSIGSNKGVSLRNGSLKLGSGSDKITLAGKVETSSVALGEGHNVLNIGGEVTGRQLLSDSRMDAAGTSWTKHVAWTVLSAGNGNDVVNLHGDAEDGVRISLGNGNNRLTAGRDMEYVQATAGSGHDSLVVKGETDDLIANLGHGNNTLTFYQSVDESVIHTGNGADKLTVHGSLEDSSLVLGGGNDWLYAREVEHSRISLGEGNDGMRVNGVLSGHVAAENGNDHIQINGSLLPGGGITLGNGNDTLVLEGMRGGLVNGGAGYDTLTLNVDNAASPFSAGGEFSGLFSGGRSAATGFERIILDLADDSRDTLLLTRQTLDNLKKVTGGQADIDLVLRGDDSRDSVQLAGPSSEYTRSGTSTIGNEVFNRYTTADGTDLYIEHDLRLTFGG